MLRSDRFACYLKFFKIKIITIRIINSAYFTPALDIKFNYLSNFTHKNLKNKMYLDNLNFYIFF